MITDEEYQVDRYVICVGLNDCVTDEQTFETEKYIKIIEYVCKNNDIAFSLEIMRGGYVYTNGTFARENSLGITLINASKEQADMVGEELCALFNQESVLILHDKVGAHYIGSKL